MCFIGTLFRCCVSRVRIYFMWCVSGSLGPSQEPTCFHTLSPDSFASLFKPKPVLCDQVLEVEIDGVRFMCHPTQV